MTGNDLPLTPAVSTPPGWVIKIRVALGGIFTPARREGLSRALAAVVIGLQGIGVLTSDKSALWGQLAAASVALLYALVWAGTALRAVLYGFLLSIGSLVMAYGIVHNVDLAIILASVGQTFGITTAAAKAQPPVLVIDR